jgi:hypothetical protein
MAPNGAKAVAETNFANLSRSHRQVDCGGAVRGKYGPTKAGSHGSGSYHLQAPVGGIMKRLLILSATTAFMLGPVATAAELPTFEVMGFPITQHQVAVVGSAHVQERSPTATLTLAGMPASPHQIAALTPRQRVAEQQTIAKEARTASGLTEPAEITAIEQAR